MIWLDTEPEPQLEYADHVSNREYILASYKGTLPAFIAAQKWYSLIPVTLVRDPAWIRLDAILERNHSAVATFVGRFEYSDDGTLVRYPTGRVENFSGFGHLSGFSRRIVIERVESPAASRP